MKVPNDLRYSRTHEWVRVEGDVATVGITDHAQAELGDVVFVDLPEIGRQLDVGEVFGSIDSVKAAADLFSPVAGEVVEVNGALAGSTELVNTDPYGDGWMIRLKLSDTSVDHLLTADDYLKFLEEADS